MPRAHGARQAVEVWFGWSDALVELVIVIWCFSRGTAGTSTFQAHGALDGTPYRYLRDRIADFVNGLGEFSWARLLRNHVATATVLRVNGGAIVIDFTARVLRERRQRQGPPLRCARILALRQQCSARRFGHRRTRDREQADPVFHENPLVIQGWLIAESAKGLHAARTQARPLVRSNCMRTPSNSRVASVPERRESVGRGRPQWALNPKRRIRYWYAPCSTVAAPETARRSATAESS